MGGRWKEEGEGGSEGRGLGQACGDSCQPPPYTRLLLEIQNMRRLLFRSCSK